MTVFFLISFLIIITIGDSEWNKFYDSRQIPMRNVPILWIVSIVVAVLLNRLVEEPMRALLRPSRADLIMNKV